MITSVHHVAYRCKSAKETVRFYQRYLDLDFTLAIAEDKVPSTGEADPYMHVFLKIDDQASLAFFELPSSPEMGADPSTPAWVQHIALRVSSREDLERIKARLLADEREVLGPVSHGIFESIYFFDPNGHRLEVALDLPLTHDGRDAREQLKALAEPMLKAWDQTGEPPKHAAWLHSVEP